jgi:hypothetical protein
MALIGAPLAERGVGHGGQHDRLRSGVEAIERAKAGGSKRTPAGWIVQATWKVEFIGATIGTL